MRTFKWYDTTSLFDSIERTRYIEEWESPTGSPHRRVHITLDFNRKRNAFDLVHAGKAARASLNRPIPLATSDKEEAQAAAIAIWRMAD